MEINSVADLANALAELGEPAPEHTRFSRGMEIRAGGCSPKYTEKSIL